MLMGRGHSDLYFLSLVDGRVSISRGPDQKNTQRAKQSALFIQLSACIMERLNIYSVTLIFLKAVRLKSESPKTNVDLFLIKGKNISTHK